MTVSTIGLDGFPKARVVLLKNFDEEGFVFLPIIIQKRVRQLIKSQYLPIVFWHTMERQVLLKVSLKKQGRNSDRYFRPDGSKLGAIVSNQSEIIPSRDF
jgi:pyridoxamine 5'-phosphate oxidase